MQFAMDQTIRYSLATSKVWSRKLVFKIFNWKFDGQSTESENKNRVALDYEMGERDSSSFIYFYSKKFFFLHKFRL